MKILFDHQIFCFKYGGAPKYFAQLLAYMPKESWSTTSLFPLCEYIKDNALFKTYKFRFRGQGRLSDIINRPYTNLCLKKRNYDVFHQTNFGTYCLNAVGDRPMVTTYHDANMSTIDPHPQIVERQKKSLERADAIICVSENTKKDMLNLFDLDDRKVHVIYHGIERNDLNKLPKERVVASPYILFVGRKSQYKNFDNFTKAFSLLHKKHKGIKVICTANEFTQTEKEEFHKMGIEEEFIHIYADEQTMLRLYRDALFFIYPSFYEGFGMPILEAWDCHCPVLLSNTSCFPEIAGDAGLYFDPKDVLDIYETMLTAIEDESVKTDLIRRGDIRINNYSWEKCADEHMKVYKSLI